MTWLQSWPTRRDRWELVATYARERCQMTQALVEQLQEAGAKPERIAGSWMVRSSEWETFNARQPFPRQEAPLATQAASQPVDVPEALSDALQRQATAIDALREQLSQLTSRLAAKETNP